MSDERNCDLRLQENLVNALISNTGKKNEKWTRKKGTSKTANQGIEGVITVIGA